MIAALLVTAALAADGDKEREPILVIGRGLIERWNDPAIATVYKSGAWLGGLGLVTPIIGPVAVDVEIGFARLKAGEATLELVPLSGLVEGFAPLGPVQGFAGLGPTWTGFTEVGGDEAVDGARIAAELRAGVRVDTQFVDPPAPPAPAGPIRALMLEINVGRRFEFPGSPPKGFHLGAWRACIGLGAAL